MALTALVSCALGMGLLAAAWAKVRDFDLFLDGIMQAVNGQPVGLVHAFAQPIASDVALYLYLASLESAAITNPQEAAGPTSGFVGA